MINNTNSMERHSALKYRIKDIISKDEIESGIEYELNEEFQKGLEEFERSSGVESKIELAAGKEVKLMLGKSRMN